MEHLKKLQQTRKKKKKRDHHAAADTTAANDDDDAPRDEAPDDGVALLAVPLTKPTNHASPARLTNPLNNANQDVRRDNAPKDHGAKGMAAQGDEVPARRTDFMRDDLLSGHGGGLYGARPEGWMGPWPPPRFVQISKPPRDRNDASGEPPSPRNAPGPLKNPLLTKDI
jgi:hypothetical protein